MENSDHDHIVPPLPAASASTGSEDFRTPEGSLAPSRTDATAPTGLRRLEENPYLEQQHHGYIDPPLPGTPAHAQESIHEFPRVESHATERAHNADEVLSTTHTSTRSSRRGGLSSIKGLLNKASLSSRRSSTRESREEGIPEENEEDKKEEPETIEQLQKRQEDPQHLLDTILEDPGPEEPLVPVGEAAVEVLAASGDSLLQSDENIAKRRQGYRENLMRTRRLRKTTRASRTVTVLRRWWRAYMSWSLISRMFFYWFPIAAILFIPLAVGEWQNRDMRLGGTRVFWIFIWLEVSWASLFVGRLLAHYLPEIFGYVISIFLPNYFKYVDALLALELPFQLLIFTFVTFISFTPILWDNSDAVQGEERPKWQKVVQDVCVAFLVSAIVFLVEQVFLYIVSTSFHKERMSLRIEKQKKSINVLTILLDAAYSFFPRGCPEFEEEDNALKHATIHRAQKTQARNKLVRTVNKKIGRASQNVSNFIDKTVTGDETKQNPAKTVKTALTNRETREVLACRIWKSLVMEDENALTYDGLVSIFGRERRDEVLFMFDILDSDGVDGIDLDEMITSVHAIGRESKQISRSLVDMNGAIRKLHYLLMTIALILVIIIFVGMLAPSSGTTIATLGSTLISLSWLFQASAQEVFQSCVFLFVKHPYDIGDWIETTVPTLGIVRMSCIHLNLTYSVFTQLGVNTRHQVSHLVLNEQFISNISRSPPSQLNIVLPIGIPETTPEHLDELADRLTEFVEMNPRDYCPGIFLHPIEQPELDKMGLNVAVGIRNNQSDIVLFSIRRTRLLEFLSQCIREIPITLPRRDETAQNDPAAPVFQYNIKTMDEALDYAEKARTHRWRAGMTQPKLLSDADSNAVDNLGEVKSSAAAAAAYQKQTGAPSFVSHRTTASRMSRRLSVSSRYSNAVGLRTHAQHPSNIHAVPPPESPEDTPKDR